MIKSYRNDYLIQRCKIKLLEDEEKSTFRALDILTQALLVDCVVKDSYSFLYLKDLFVKTFLRKNSKSFEERLNNIFQAIEVKDSKDKFTIYFRVQAKSILKDIVDIPNITFSESINLDRKKIDKKQKKHIETFFYLNKENNQNLIFITAKDIKATDFYQATILAFEKIMKIFQQIKFEYELKYFSIDNTIYTFNQTDDKFLKTTSKQINSSRYGQVGNIKRLKKILLQINNSSKTDDEKKRVFIQKMINITLEWHKMALDSDSLNSRFLHHWIGLEQLFNLIDNIPIENTESSANSSSDKLIICFDKVIQKSLKTKLLYDLWGDIVRSKILGVKRVVATENGLYKNTTKFVSGTNILIHNREKVVKGEWIASSNYSHLEKSNSEILAKLFKDITPRLENILFILLNPLVDKPKHKYYQNPIRMIDALHLYEDLEKMVKNKVFKDKINCQDDKNSVKCFMNNFHKILLLDKEDESLKFLQKFIEEYQILEEFYPNYLELQEFWQKIETNLTDLSPHLLCELFYNQTPLMKNFENLITKEDTKNDLIQLCKSQPLLEYRIEEIHNYLNNKNNLFPSNFFIIELDKMRKLRNNLVYEAISKDSLELLTQRFYKYSRAYLRETLYSLAVCE